MDTIKRVFTQEVYNPGWHKTINIACTTEYTSVAGGEIVEEDGHDGNIANDGGQ